MFTLRGGRELENPLIIHNKTCCFSFTRCIFNMRKFKCTTEESASADWSKCVGLKHLQGYFEDIQNFKKSGICSLKILICILLFGESAAAACCCCLEINMYGM